MGRCLDGPINVINKSISTAVVSSCTVEYEFTAFLVQKGQFHECVGRLEFPFLLSQTMVIVIQFHVLSCLRVNVPNILP